MDLLNIQKTTIIDAIEALAFPNITIQDMERILVNFIKSKFSIKEIKEIIHFNDNFNDYLEFYQCYNPQNPYEQALLELIKEQHPDHLKDQDFAF